MRATGKQVFDKVLFPLFHSHHPFAAPPLAAIGTDGGPLDVALVADGDDAGFVGNEIFDVHLAFIGHNVGPTGVAILLFDRQQFALHERHQLLLAGKQSPQKFDELDEFEIFLLNLVAFEAGQLIEAHVKNSVGLDLGELELRH